jgi:hypothetical protein
MESDGKVGSNSIRAKGVVMYSNMAKNPVRWIYVKVKAVANILTRVTIGKKCSCLLSSSLL